MIWGNTLDVLLYICHKQMIMTCMVKILKLQGFYVKFESRLETIRLLNQTNGMSAANAML